ncbi:uncharacterized protein PV07_12363 [Cladophialophora immunda]|uniref:Uncharacterized protein n=1 Tax=Cladophialophora immunda TaxID=569365 RepID=A0A0D2CG40_9EURO|nr:uncharacterized protein PV07_12363 [Cladophialophora immunda]KIW22479.1 hypothetical protein PV07_12363 [Cladophialophora immunda]
MAFGIVRFGGPDDWNLIKELPFCSADFEVRSTRYLDTSTILQVIATHPSDPVEWLAYVLAQGVDVNEADIWAKDGCDSPYRHCRSRGPPLQQSCFYGLESCATLLLDSGADINYSACELGSPLQAATRSSHHAMVRLLLDRHADVNQVGGEFGTPLQAAVWVGDKELILLLLDNGADINSTGGALGSPLAAAIAKQHSGIIDLLFDRDADPGSTAYLQLMKIGRANSLAISAGFEYIWGEICCRTPLIWAVHHEDKTMVQKLLMKGAGVNFPSERCRINTNFVRNSQLYHPLCPAIKTGNAEIIELIRQSSANIWIDAG